MKVFRDQFAAGGRFVGKMSGFGSGLNARGDLGAGPGLMAWYCLGRRESLVSAAFTDEISSRQNSATYDQDSLLRSGTPGMRVFPSAEIKRFFRGTWN